MHEVVAGVVDPPGPEEVRLLVDQVLRGVARGDFGDTLSRAAAFARVCSVGRAHLPPETAGTTYSSDLSAARLLTMAEQGGCHAGPAGRAASGARTSANTSTLICPSRRNSWVIRSCSWSPLT